MKIKTKLNYKNINPNRFFDAASIGKSPEEAKDMAEKYKENLDWTKCNIEVQRKFARLLNVPTENIRNYYNTTAAIQRIFSFIRDNVQDYSCPLLTTDEEYPGIVSLLDEFWPGSVYFAEVSSFIWDAEGDMVEEFLLNACRFVKPRVIYLSHVFRTNGFRIPSATVGRIRKMLPRSIIIIDGAQAAGNIVIEKTVLENVDFYITSGHKWLCGMTSLGLVYTPIWQSLISDPAQSYSRQVGSGGTGVIEALISFQISIEEFLGKNTYNSSDSRMQEVANYNKFLANEFIETWNKKKQNLESIDKNLPKPNPLVFCRDETNNECYRTGIVTLMNCPIGLADSLGNMPTSVKEEMKYKFTVVKEELWRSQSEGMHSDGPRFLISSGKRNQDLTLKPLNLYKEMRPYKLKSYGECLRFCFHVYHHSIQAVNGLVKAIAKSWENLSIKGK